MKKIKLNRNRNYYRKQRIRAILRKLEIRKFQWGSDDVEEFYDSKMRGKLSKGKIHCSCYMCRVKSSDSLHVKDLRKLDSYVSELNEYYFKF